MLVELLRDGLQFWMGVCRCKNLSVNCFPAAPPQPLRGRWNEGERSEPSGTEPAGVGFRESVVVGGPRGVCVGVFNKNILTDRNLLSGRCAIHGELLSWQVHRSRRYAFVVARQSLSE